jgi:hypothetical protein
MAQEPTQRLIKAMVETLSDSRTNINHAANSTLNEADRNNFLQNNLWQFVVAYLYNRASRYRLGLIYDSDQDYIGARANDMVTEFLEPEYQTYQRAQI